MTVDALPEPTDPPVEIEADAEAQAEILWVAPALASAVVDTDTLGPIAAEGPTPAGPDPLLAAVSALGSDLGRRIDALQAAFERENRAEEAREKVVDRLHAELQEYKQGLLLGMLRPVFVDLIQLHDDIGKMAAAAAPEAGGPLAAVQQGIEDILYRQGVEPFRTEDDAFDPRRQRAIATAPTDDPTLAKTVAARHRAGFRAGEKVIRPELVTVHALRR